MSKIEKAIAWALSIANDPAHGYDQTKRWGPDYDCSSFVIEAFKKAGLPLTATYTGNIRYDFLRHGFVDAASLGVIELNMGAGLKRGDVLLHDRNHTAIYLGNGQIIQASINERGGITGGQTGDQTGGEIGVRSYYNYPWDVVLRYVEENDYPSVGEAASSPDKGSREEGVAAVTAPTTQGGQLPLVQSGSRGNAVIFLQMLLMHKWGYALPRYGADGDFGGETRTALVSFQQEHGLEADGACGPLTWAALIGG